MDRASAEQPPFLFVVGCARSGTTLLRSMIDANPMIAIPPESHFIPRMAARAAAQPTFDPEEFCTSLFDHHRFQLWSMDTDAVRAAVLADPSAADLPDAIRRLYGCYAAEHGKPRYGDKTPAYLQRMALLARLFPEARFVHLVRDGRDVASALLAADWGPRSLGEAALHWRAAVVAGRSAGRQLGDRYLEASYEDLVNDPATVLQRVCAFADLSFDEVMLRPEDRAERMLAGLRREKDHTSLRLPVTKGLRDWRRDLDDRDVAVIEMLIGDALTDAGYELRFAHPSSTARRQALVTKAKVKVSVLSRRLWRGGRKRLRRPRG